MSTDTFYSKTPTVTVFDNRGLTVRDITNHRHPDSPDVTDERITRHQYDARGFLTQMRHSAPATNNNYTTAITVSDRSNRAVLSTLTEKPAEVDALFTAGRDKNRRYALIGHSPSRTFRQCAMGKDLKGYTQYQRTAHRMMSR